MFSVSFCLVADGVELPTRAIEKNDMCEHTVSAKRHTPLSPTTQPSKMIRTTTCDAHELEVNITKARGVATLACLNAHAASYSDFFKKIHCYYVSRCEPFVHAFQDGGQLTRHHVYDMLNTYSVLAHAYYKDEWDRIRPDMLSTSVMRCYATICALKSTTTNIGDLQQIHADRPALYGSPNWFISQQLYWRVLIEYAREGLETPSIYAHVYDIPREQVTSEYIQAHKDEVKDLFEAYVISPLYCIMRRFMLYHVASESQLSITATEARIPFSSLC